MLTKAIHATDNRNHDRIEPGRFNVIYADPPWNFETYSDNGKGRSAEQHYSTMTAADICALPVSDLAAKDAVLMLWATFPRLPDAFEVITAWGFTYKTVGFTWVKQNRRGFGFFTGMGYHTRSNAEICLLASRGRGLSRVDSTVLQLVVEPVREHSRKPAVVRRRIERLYGDVPRIELFARQQPDGWAAWGNQVESDVELAGYRPYSIAEKI